PRGAVSPGDTRPHVSSHFVGAEKVDGRGRFPHRGKIRGGGIEGGKVSGAERDADEGEGHQRGDHRGRPTHEPPDDLIAAGARHAPPRMRGLATKYRTSARRLR